MKPLERLGNLARAVGLAKRRCVACATICDPDQQLCADCAGQLGPRLTGYCPSCGALNPNAGDPPTPCADCLTSSKPWERLHFHAQYAGLLRKLIRQYKFNDGLQLGRLLQQFMLDAYQRNAEGKPDFIVPVPMHPKRLRERGYNQSLELARELSKELGVPISNEALVRVRHTIPQSSLRQKERLTNLDQAFSADTELVSGKHILLIDDVCTTGSTITECTRTLMNAGAESVEVVVLAVT